MTTRNEILAAAMLLPEDERLAIAGQLQETVPADCQDWSTNEEFLDELDRRVNDLQGSVPAEDLWQADANGD